MKNVKILFFPILICVIFCMTVLAVMAADAPRLVDEAGLLSAEEASGVLAALDEISERQQFDLVVVTTNSLDGYDVQAYADDFFDYNGYGFGTERDGMLLLVDMGERMWALSTSGYGLYAFTDNGLAYMENCFLDALSRGDYAEAFQTYAAQSDALIALAKQGTPYGSDDGGYDYDYDGEYYQTAFDVQSALGISFIVGLIGAGIVVMSMAAQLKSVRQQNAGAYQRQGSLNITDSREIFLYRNVTKTRRQDNDSSSGGSRSGGTSIHRSSSGRSHGGRSGRF